MNFPSDKILAQHAILLGKTRSGKSSVMRLLVEGLLDRGRPVCVVDPKGDWFGLKLSGDGRHAGYPVVIFGGEHADVPINEHAGAQVAELFATGNRPCLIDLGGWMTGPRTRFWIDFASTLFRLTKGERWLVIDECHHFAPKGKIFDVDAGKGLHWACRLSSEGLGKGLHLVEASQRPQKVHNDKLTSAETLIAMRVIHPSDRGAVADWIKGCGDSDGGEVLNSLAQMARGEGWVWSPEIGFGPERVKFPLFKTYDSFRPQTVADAKQLKGWAEVDLDEVRTKMAAVIERARAEDPAVLRKRIAELEREVGRLSAAAPPTRVETREVKVVEDAQIARVEQAVAKLYKWHDAAAQAQQVVVSELGNIRAQLAAVGAPAPAPMPRTEPVAPRSAAPRSPQPAAPGQEHMPVGERAILTAVAQHADGVTREQLTVLTGYKRSSRDTYLQKIRQRGYAEERLDRIYATPEGFVALGPRFERLPTGDALREYWIGRLVGGEKRILEVVVRNYPEPVSREAISEETGYKRSSRDTYLQKLAARRLVAASRSEVKAADMLFGGGAP